jgi:hypothetical protein
MKKPHRPERESAAGAASGQFDDSPRRAACRAAVARITGPRWIAATLGALRVAAIGAWFVWADRGQSLWAVSFLADRVNGRPRRATQGRPYRASVAT